MKNEEIKRKFFANTLPDLTGKVRETYERFYLLSEGEIELRIQKVNERYELERLIKSSGLGRNKQNIEISKTEFELFKKLAENGTVRDSFVISENPLTTLRIYHGKYEGLKRIEVAFKSEAEAEKYIPQGWFGKEITNTPLWRDALLLKLSDDEFSRLILEYSK